MSSRPIKHGVKTTGGYQMVKQTNDILKHKLPHCQLQYKNNIDTASSHVSWPHTNKSHI